MDLSPVQAIAVSFGISLEERFVADTYFYDGRSLATHISPGLLEKTSGG